MGIRAYGVKTLKREKVPTFHLWHESELMQALEDAGLLTRIGENGGLITVSSDDINKLLSTAKKNDTKTLLQKLLKHPMMKKDGYLTFVCG